MKKLNILQIDVEDWYSDINFKQWHIYEDRIIQNTSKVLALLKERDVQATFFVLGHIAKKFPQLVEDIQKEGHEISSHGYNHIPLTEQTPSEFEEDLLKSVKVLKQITKEKIWGYRAPLFTVVEKTSWAISILKKNGFRYDSSISPVITPLSSVPQHGISDAPLYPYHISSSDIKKESLDDDFLEFPTLAYPIPIIKKNIPIGGGFYLRFFPYSFMVHAIKKRNKKNFPAVCYIHPWELDPEQPRIDSIKWFHYYRLRSTERKFKKLLKDFKFISTREWIENEG